MVEVHRSTIINAPLAAVWDIIRDFNGHDRWHPIVVQSSIVDKLPVDMVGAVRDFVLADGSRIQEQLISLSDKDHSFQYCILDSPIPLNGYIAKVHLRPVTDGDKTLWEWTSTFHPPLSRQDELAEMVGDGIYEVGFNAVRSLLEGGEHSSYSKRAPKLLSTARPQLMASSERTSAIVLAAHGGPEMMQLQSIDVPPPELFEVRVRQTMVGVNYIDVYSRTGYFDLVSPGNVLGMEAAGVVEAVGANVDNFLIGDRVAYACAPPGSYAGLRNIAADRLVNIPPYIPDDIVAGSLLKGTTASFLLHDIHRVKPGETVLVHAAAGGVGQLLCQWASAIGAHVIGTVSSAEKATRAKAAGCKEVIIYSEVSFVDEVKRITHSQGCDVIYDAVGKDTFEGSLACLKPRGHLISFGQASGDIGAYEIGRLASKSVTLSRPNYGHYTSTADDIMLHAGRLFQALSDGHLRLDHPTLYPLRDVGRAHADLESRRTTGSIVLVP